MNIQNEIKSGIIESRRHASSLRNRFHEEVLSNTCIVVPAYNEAFNLKIVLQDLQLFCKDYACALLIVDDGSNDGTDLILESFKVNNLDLEICVLIHNKNRGYGSALKTGIMNVDKEFVITMDADGQHDPNDIIALSKKMIGYDADMCVGNREYRGSTFIKNITKRSIRFLVNIFTGIQIHDLNSGMKMYKTDVARRLVKYAPDGMPFSDAMVLLHHQFKYKIVEQPIRTRKRTQGSSRAGVSSGLSTIREVFNLILHFFPFRFFLYLSMIVLITAIIWGAPYVIQGKGLTVGTSFLLLLSVNLLLFGVIFENIVRLRFQDHRYKH